MSKTGTENTADLSGRTRVGPEDEAREDQFHDDGLGPTNEDEDRPGLAGEEAPEADRKGLETSNDLTAP